jgi:uncharacterized protein (TIGR02284 family)
VKSIFTGYDRHAVLANLETWEDATQRAYRMALDQEVLPAYLRELLVRQQVALKESHDEVRAVRDQYA